MHPGGIQEYFQSDQSIFELFHVYKGIELLMHLMMEGRYDSGQTNHSS